MGFLSGAGKLISKAASAGKRAYGVANKYAPGVVAGVKKDLGRVAGKAASKYGGKLMGKASKIVGRQAVQALKPVGKMVLNKAKREAQAYMSRR